MYAQQNSFHKISKSFFIYIRYTTIKENKEHPFPFSFPYSYSIYIYTQTYMYAWNPRSQRKREIEKKPLVGYRSWDLKSRFGWQLKIFGPFSSLHLQISSSLSFCSVFCVSLFLCFWALEYLIVSVCCEQKGTKNILVLLYTVSFSANQNLTCRSILFVGPIISGQWDRFTSSFTFFFLFFLWDILLFIWGIISYIFGVLNKIYSFINYKLKLDF